jgi:NADH:ubiquinone oxidoreductase subunit 2 (subunit N)
VCFFATLLTIRKNREIQTFDDLMGITRDSPMVGCCLISSMFAMSGIPPFATFLAKIQILEMQISNGHYVLMVLSIGYSIMITLAISKALSSGFWVRTIDFKLIRHNIIIHLTLAILILLTLFYPVPAAWIAALVHTL